MKKKNWLAERQRGIGGSDAAAILGFSPWKSAIDVYMEKTGQAEEAPEDKQKKFLLQLGQDLEPVIARLYERETGQQLMPPAPKRWEHPKHKMLVGTPDRIVRGQRLGVEIKSENQFQSEFGEPGTDDVPYHYLIQCAHYMAIGNYPSWDLALLHGGSRFAIYHIQRDRELEEFMVDELLRWWEKHIVGRQLPDVDFSDGWKTFLRKTYPANVLPLRPTDEDSLFDVKHLAYVRESLAALENEKTAIENRLKLTIGDHEGLAGDFGKITWRKTKDSEHINYAQAFDELALTMTAPKTICEETLKACTTTKPGVRRFLFTPRKEWYGSLREEAQRQFSVAVGAPQIGNSEGPAETP